MDIATITRQYYDQRATQPLDADTGNRLFDKMMAIAAETDPESAKALLLSEDPVVRLAGCYALYKTEPEVVRPVAAALASVEPLGISGNQDEAERQRRLLLNSVYMDAEGLLWTLPA